MERSGVKRAKTKAELLQSERRLRLALDATNVGLWLGDFPFIELFWDTTVKKHFWLSPNARITLDTLYARLHPDDRASVYRAIKTSITERTGCDIEFRAVSQAGQFRWIRAIGRASYDKTGTPLHFDGVTIDVTERKQAEALLREQAAMLQMADDAFIVQDTTNRILFWSEGARKMYGWQQDEAVGKIALDLLETRFPLPFQEIVQFTQTQGSWSGELLHKTKDGRQLVVHSSWIPIQGGEQFKFLEVNRDISLQKALEQRKDDFMSIASHELKTPLTVLKTNTQLMLRNSRKQGDEKQINMLERMEKQIDKLNALVSELLDFSRIQSGMLKYVEESVDFDALVCETVTAMQTATPTHTLTIYGSTGVTLSGDTARLGQVITNLLSNAIKYSPQAQRVDLFLERAGHIARLRVRDYGIGIPKADQPRIFDRFYRVFNPKTKYLPGMGMGLYITYEIVTHHGGTISVESEEGKGTTFTVSLPISHG